MRQSQSKRSTLPFPFVFEELVPIRPTVKQMFGFTHFYLDQKLLCSLRDSEKRPATNGMWLYTTTDDLESLGREFPQLPKRYWWRSGKNAWIVLPAKLEGFEEFAFKACELIVQGDRRVGRVTRGSGSKAPVGRSILSVPRY